MRAVGAKTMLWAAAVLALIPFSAFCDEGVLAPHGPVGVAERVILIDATVIMLAVIIPVIILTLAFAWWFRAENPEARYLPDWEYSGSIEMIVWAIPALIIMFLGGIAWIGSHDLDPPSAIASDVAPIEVQVISLDWKWLFIYPREGIASVNRLVVPTGRPIRFQLTSANVMNSFFIPQLGSQIYTMPNMTTRLVLQADTAGTYKGLSAQFSGEGFSDMRFEVVAESQDQYGAWIAQAKAGGKMLNNATYIQLARPSSNVEAMTYSSVVSGLFEDVSGSRAMAAMPSHKEH